LKILVVDDEKDVRDMIATMLNRAGYETVTAEDGESAIKAFESSNCSIVLLDWSMPEMSGLEVAERIQEIRDAYIVMVTGRAKGEIGEMSLEAGARDYIEKPFEPAELIECVKAAEAVVTARQLLRKRFKRLGLDVDIVNQVL
jgi:DNA-binding response OmpR family regulator